MATYSTDFSEYTVGNDLSDWSDFWAIGNVSWTAQNNGGGDFVAGTKYLKFWRDSGDGTTALTWDDIGTPADTDTLVLLRHNIASMGVNTMRVGARISGATGSKNAYWLWLTSSTIKIMKWVAGAQTELTTINSTLYGAANGWVWCRFRVDGTNLYGKVWAVNEVEPDDWTVTASDSDLSSGAVGLGQWQWLTRMDVEFFECETGGGTATFPPDDWVGDDIFGPLIFSVASQYYFNTARTMGGVFTNAGRYMNGVAVYCTDHSDDVRIAVYSGGVLANGPGSSGDEATLLYDFGKTSGAVVNDWVTLSCDPILIPDGEPLWIVVKGDNAAGFESIENVISRLGTTADYQTARGRGVVTAQVGTDPDVAFAATFPTGNATFSNDTMAYYISLVDRGDAPTTTTTTVGGSTTTSSSTTTTTQTGSTTTSSSSTTTTTTMPFKAVTFTVS